MRNIRDLSEVEVRVLGALLEKEQATPDYYPLTVNALLAACNQKSNREPVTKLNEEEILEVLDALRRDVLAWRTEGARVERWSQSISRRLELDPGEKAVLTLLMLRGPQTPGALRSRSQRLHAFDSLHEVEEALERMAVVERELVIELPRRPGQKENRWGHLLAGTIESSPTPQARPEGLARGPGLAERIGALEERIEELMVVVENLQRQIES